MKKLILIALLLSACGNRYPLGMQEAQWNSLSPAEQQQAVAKQAEQDELLRQQYQAALYQQQEQQLFDERERLEFGARQRLGITQEEWLRLNPDKKLDLRQEQEAIEREFHGVQQGLDQENALALAARDIAGAIDESSRRALYTNSAYGSVVDCELSGGNGKFSTGLWKSKWAPIAPVRFTVAKGDGIHVEFRRLDKLKVDESFWVGFDHQTLEFCAAEDTEKRYKRCRTYPVSDVYKQGYSTAFNIPSVIDGATLNCRFAAGRT